MPGRAIVVAFAVIALVITQARALSSNPDQVVAFGFLAILALIIVLDRQARQKRKRLHAAAVAEWQCEFSERMRIELDRGVTDTMSRFMVEPVMERCFPRTYEDAVVFLDSRGVVVQNDPRGRTIDTDVVPLPDSRYGVSKVFGEAVGALYAMKHGLGVLSIRIGNVGDQPIDERRLAIWLKPEDLVSLIRIGLERPGLVYEVVYGLSDNARAWWDDRRTRELGYQPAGRAEDFAAAALAAQAALPADEVGDFFQGGSFCSEEFDGDFARLRQEPSGD